ncbi:PqiC family protein [Roseivivax isoporae]|uniref:ABC-type transport auxiliary lipoprotein component domain-containing protein n=1 Tax=Roseivivax isoporae LMG 25204 TaxID=1449351 RepID=X7F929_9RHOB|nr:ABC-type transport auxiliary lipoprotein family protein [Roseivivax isoporae]ETX28564.1 hypothetical protein RISW2_05590 [Roseivivax isoporae LMG 25204]
MTFRTGLAALALTFVAACGGDVYTPVPPSAPDLRLPSRYATIEVVEVQLPTYAASEDIFVEREDGTLEALGPLWADDPARAITLQLSRDVSRITGAQAAPEPWPFRDFAAAKLDVRLDDMRATAAGDFLLSGQFFVAPDSGGGNRAGTFAITVPMADGAGAVEIARARSAAVTQLAEDVARRGL